MKCVFSIDVEDWFHILDLPSTPGLSSWDSFPSRVEKNFLRLLDVFAESNVRVTCFFLGWLADKHPHLVREAKERGNEIASHGYSHKLVYSMSSMEFFQDALRSRQVLEDIVGSPVLGYRAPGFSVTAHTPWFFEKLIEAGYTYDSSVFPTRRQHGGISRTPIGPFLVQNGNRPFVEFPVSVVRVFNKLVCFFGGGYLRLFPVSLIEKMTFKVLSEGRPAIFYVHPREIDHLSPRLPMSLRRRWMSYMNLDTTEPKIRRLISRFKFTSFAGLLDEQYDGIAQKRPIESGSIFSPFPAGS